MKRFATLFLAIVPFIVFAQKQPNERWVVLGEVRDENGAPVIGASVYELDKCGTATDTLGRFALVCTTRPRYITARYFGYFAQQIKLQKADFQQNKANISIKMLSQTPALKEVTITAKPIEVIVEEDYSKDLYDFGFAGEHLLLLVREKKNYYLRLMSEQGRTISQIKLPEPCKRLHRSCMGDFHAVGLRSVWEVTLAADKVDTMTRYSLDNFRKLIEPCVQALDNQYYFRKYGLLNQSITYTVYQEGQKPKKLFEITDKRGQDNANGAIGDFLSGKPFIWRTPERQDNITNPDLRELQLDQGQADPYASDQLLQHVCHSCYDQLYRLSELENIRSDSVYVPLLNVRDTLCLFDHVNGKMLRFGPNIPQTEVIPIRYFLEKGWRKQLIQDESSDRIYARFARLGGMILREIDTRNGQALNTYDLSIAPYLADKYKIKNGNLYYIGQPDVNIPNRMLYRMNVFAMKVNSSLSKDYTKGKTDKNHIKLGPNMWEK